jgi:hypothetical protein
MKGGVIIVLSLFFVLTIMSLVSANIFKDIGELFSGTGKVPQQPQDVSVSVVGKKPVVVEVPTLSVMPVEGTFVSVIFTANVSDDNGVNDINDSSVTTLIGDGVTTRVGSCVWDQDITNKKANYSCSIDMWYWDAPSALTTWALNVSATDKGNKTIITQGALFNYGEVKSLTIAPSSISWTDINSEDTNQNASNDPTIINNSGNYNGLVKVIGIDLKGETIDTEIIPAASFTVGPSSGTECLATPLVNGSSASIGSSNSNPGNLSAGGGIGQSQLYYCIPTVPLISSQTYSTLGGGSWTILY